MATIDPHPEGINQIASTQNTERDPRWLLSTMSLSIPILLGSGCPQRRQQENLPSKKTTRQ